VVVAIKRVLGTMQKEGEISILVLLFTPVPEPSREECCSWHIREGPATAIYIFESNHTFLPLQKRSSVQNSYITKISLFNAKASVCRRIGKSSNKLKSSAIDLSLAEALPPDLIPELHCQVHW